MGSCEADTEAQSDLLPPARVGQCRGMSAAGPHLCRILSKALMLFLGPFLSDFCLFLAPFWFRLINLPLINFSQNTSNLAFQNRYSFGSTRSRKSENVGTCSLVLARSPSKRIFELVPSGFCNCFKALILLCFTCFMFIDLSFNQHLN